MVFVAPPRTITDITAILDAEKPDSKKIEERVLGRMQSLPLMSLRQMARFYHDRGIARSELGRLKEAIEDANQAL